MAWNRSTPNPILEDITLREITEDSFNAEMDDATEYERLLADSDKRTTKGKELRESIRDGDDHLAENGNYDEALNAAGFGKYTIILTLICGWANASDSVEMLSVSFILPSAEKDLNLSSQDKGLLNSIIFAGMMVGAYFWGSLADIYGRRKVLLYSMTLNAAFGLASSFAQQFWLFLLLRFLSGVGVGGAGPTIFSYFGEFQQRERRGMMISWVSFFWLAASGITAGLAWAVIPSGIGFYNDDGFSFESWRVFVAFCTIPAATSVITFFFLPESPKFLLENGKAEEALEIMRTMYVWNNKGVTKADYPIAVLLPSANCRKPKSEIRSTGLIRFCTKIVRRIRMVVIATIKLFQAPLTRATNTLCVVTFSLACGYYGLWMWFPQLFAHVESGSGSVCSDAQANSTSPDNGTTTDEFAIYKDAFFTALSNLPGNLISVFLLDIVGRKILLSSSMILAGISVFFIWFLKTRIQVLVMSCIFGGISVIAWNSLNVITVELYPTNIRVTAMGFNSVIIRSGAIIGNLLFGVLIDENCAVPILTVAVLLAFGGISVVLLPNTLKKVLQ